MNKLFKNKKGVSILIGYVLLITIAIIMGSIIYTWLKSYVPTETIECPEGVSLYVKNVECYSKDGGYELNLSIENNGRFKIDGYYIKTAKESYQKIATQDISKDIISGGKSAGGVVQFNTPLNVEKDAPLTKFQLDESIAFIEIIPIIYEKVDNNIKLVSCGNAKIKEEVDCE